MSLRFSEWLPLAAIIVGLFLSQFLGLPHPAMAFFSLFAVLACGYLGGKRLFPESPTGIATVWGTISSVALLMLLRGAWFYLGERLDGWSDLWTTTSLIVIVMGFLLVSTIFDGNSHTRHHTERRPELLAQVLEFLLLIVSIAGFLLVARAALRNGTDLSIRTPWPLMPWWTLPVIGTLWSLTLVSAWNSGRAAVVALHAACAIGATAVLTPLLYVIGYGFDGFLHVAGETVLAQTGTLLPKPPYYMGQYVFVTWIAGLFDLSIAVVDRWLVPAAAMILIPAAGAMISKKRQSTILAAFVLIPLSAFIATTPHGFATVLAVAALILMVGANTPITAILVALWATLTHPLVGLPVLIAIIAAMFWRETWMKWSISLPLAILAGMSVPLVFGLASSAGSSTGVEFNLGHLFDGNTWSSIISGLLPWVPNRFALWPQAAGWIAQLLPWVVVVMAGMGMLNRHERDEAMPRPYAWPIASLSTFIAALILKVAGDFGFLIDYERGNYADRLFMVAWILLLPIALPEFARRLEIARRARIIPKIAVIVVIGFLGAGVSYAALPRHDALITGRGWSVGRADIEAVKLIDQDAAGEPYTVLANQSVSAAAVKTFGFKRYHGDVFFYPIPTGGPLYDVFLHASYENPSRETMQDAARLGGSSLVYFVVNDYWWDFGKLTERASSSTNRVFEIQNGKVKVFKYDLQDE